MRKTKLIHLLKNMSTRERTRFRELVFSPFFNKNEKVRRLCDYLLDYAPAFEDAALGKKEAFSAVFGKDKNYDELGFNNIISDLLQLAYDLLAWQQYEQQPQLRQDLLLSQLLERDLATVHFDQQAQKFRQCIRQEGFQSFDHFYHDYRYYDQLDQYSLSQARRYDEGLQRKSDNLDQYFIINKLRIACDMLSRNTVVNAGYQCHFLNEITGYYYQHESALQSLPVVRVYMLTLQLLREQKEDLYFDWKKLLGANNRLFPASELRILYNYGLNYCVRKINSGDTTFYREIFELYRLLLEYKIIFRNGTLTQWTFVNIATSGIRLGEFTWTEYFIQNYKQYLLPEARGNVVNYCLASVYYEKKDYKQALQLLHEVAFPDAFYHLAAKIIQLKSYFELRETEAFYSLLEAARLYISRNKQLSEYQKQSNINFCKMAARLYHYHTDIALSSASKVEKERQSLARAIASVNPLANKNWLIQRLAGE